MNNTNPSQGEVTAQPQQVPPVSDQTMQAQTVQTQTTTTTTEERVIPTKGADAKVTPGAVAVGLLVVIPLMILAPIAEFFGDLFSGVVWLSKLFRNKWFIAFLIIVLIFLMLAFIGYAMEGTSAVTK